jgi:hypothetical protein
LTTLRNSLSGGEAQEGTEIMWKDIRYLLEFKKTWTKCFIWSSLTQYGKATEGRRTNASRLVGDWELEDYNTHLWRSHLKLQLSKALKRNERAQSEILKMDYQVSTIHRLLQYQPWEAGNGTYWYVMSEAESPKASPELVTGPKSTLSQEEITSELPLGGRFAHTEAEDDKKNWRYFPETWRPVFLNSLGIKMGIGSQFTFNRDKTEMLSRCKVKKAKKSKKQDPRIQCPSIVTKHKNDCVCACTHRSRVTTGGTGQERHTPHSPFILPVLFELLYFVRFNFSCWNLNIIWYRDLNNSFAYAVLKPWSSRSLPPE